MKIKFYVHEYYWPPKKDKPASRYLARYAKLQEATPELELLYTSYIFDAISSDFQGKGILSCEEVLNEINKIEHEGEGFFVWNGGAFIHTINRDIVSFEHAVFGECLEWPIQSFPLSHYKTSLEGWIKFCNMPESTLSELIIDLPQYLHQ
jgi:hypothetical protein